MEQRDYAAELIAKFDILPDDKLDQIYKLMITNIGTSNTSIGDTKELDFDTPID